MIYPRQIKAARALLGISQAELATAVGVGLATVKRIEANSGELRFRVETMLRIKETLEERGVVFIDADKSHGPGVRLEDPGAR